MDTPWRMRRRSFDSRAARTEDAEFKYISVDSVTGKVREARSMPGEGGVGTALRSSAGASTVAPNSPSCFVSTRVRRSSTWSPLIANRTTAAVWTGMDPSNGGCPDSAGHEKPSVRTKGGICRARGSRCPGTRALCLDNRFRRPDTGRHMPGTRTPARAVSGHRRTAPSRTPQKGRGRVSPPHP
jgi:hypothetical protein